MKLKEGRISIQPIFNIFSTLLASYTLSGLYFIVSTSRIFAMDLIKVRTFLGQDYVDLFLIAFLLLPALLVVVVVFIFKSIIRKNHISKALGLLFTICFTFSLMGATAYFYRHKIYRSISSCTPEAFQRRTNLTDKYLRCGFNKVLIGKSLDEVKSLLSFSYMEPLSCNCECHRFSDGDYFLVRGEAIIKAQNGVFLGLWGSIKNVCQP